MKLASLASSSRDGQLVVVSKDGTRAASAQNISPSLICLLEKWQSLSPALDRLYQSLNRGEVAEAFAFQPQLATAPLPRAPQWCDGSAFINHARLMETAFHTPPIADLDTIPLMYQGASDDFLGPHQDIALPDEAQGIDFEGEFGVILDEVPLGCPVDQALSYVLLIVLINDVSLRHFGPREMKTGFGFLQAKPSSSFAPLAITPDELGSAWRDGRVALPLQVRWNEVWFGNPNGAEMSFGFQHLIAHAAATRKLSAGTIIGSGTVSNSERSAGSACIAERRGLEMIEHGAISTQFMRFGDRVQMEARDAADQLIFGAIDQRVVKCPVLS
ncbi:fumarylacetoacetate hydrolase family protein [Undibacterium sp. RTI2.1]|uniref:fumarylacetoacetate hydrolase family protein n=1 Tax=unclassified Undibacterium TaxID=2630295 RepID=UPI002B222397|nr:MULTISPECIES: fumarylacetoacetate hydrolase family protein [unclassified Undibacterium]MEB0030322.1 fumarylacetoacetate hydrolase family protein [Undibacterium sp. RTI2.1]MEB0115398.1 fumarylacetoacetate hydrolase family protein [Undibacterium sp. RTI2.2]